MSSIPDEFALMDSRAGHKRLVNSQTLLSATRDRKLWRAMIPYDLKRHRKTASYLSNDFVRIDSGAETKRYGKDQNVS